MKEGISLARDKLQNCCTIRPFVQISTEAYPGTTGREFRC